jgi:excisionase family DNA binding protein
MPYPEQAASEVLTLSEMAGYLKVSKKTILRMVQAGQMPAVKISGQWRLLRSFIDDWLRAELRSAGGENLPPLAADARTAIPVSRLVTPERTLTDI